MSGGDEDDDAAPRSIWDAVGDDDAPLDPLRLVEADVSPRDAPTALGDGADAWRDAEQSLGRPLAEAAAAFARLDERLRAWTPAQAKAGVARLALAQAAALLWAEGATIEVERLTLWGAARIGRAADEDHATARAAWAARRLAAARWSLTSPAAVARFQERLAARRADATRPEAPWPAFARARGDAWVEAAEAWAASARALRDAHPFTQACLAESAWRRAGLSDAAAVVEPAVVAMKVAARAGRGGAPFAPLARRRTPGGGGAADRLERFCRDLAAGCADAQTTLERAQAWRSRAESGVADLSGRTPRRLVELLAARVAVSAPEAARAADVSVSAALRNLALLVARGLAREITGQGRFRLWAAAW